MKNLTKKELAEWEKLFVEGCFYACIREMEIDLGRYEDHGYSGEYHGQSIKNVKRFIRLSKKDVEYHDLIS